MIADCLTQDKRFPRGLQDAVFTLRENGFDRSYVSVKNRLAGCCQKPRQKTPDSQESRVKDRIADLESQIACLEKRLAVRESMNRCLIKQLAAANKYRVARMLQWQGTLRQISRVKAENG